MHKSSAYFLTYVCPHFPFTVKNERENLLIIFMLQLAKGK